MPVQPLTSAEFAMLCIINSMPQAWEAIDKGFLSTSAVEERRRANRNNADFQQESQVGFDVFTTQFNAHNTQSEQDV